MLVSLMGDSPVPLSKKETHENTQRGERQSIGRGNEHVAYAKMLSRVIGVDISFMYAIYLTDVYIRYDEQLTKQHKASKA